jgi:hypothetical protein
LRRFARPSRAPTPRSRGEHMFSITPLGRRSENAFVSSTLGLVAGGCCCRHRHCVGRRRLGQRRCCPLRCASIRKGRCACASSHRLDEPRKGKSKLRPYAQHPTRRISMHLPKGCGGASVLTEVRSSYSGVSVHYCSRYRICSSEKTLPRTLLNEAIACGFIADSSPTATLPARRDDLPPARKGAYR